jgi:NAD(P) transhydrogenase subunit beta
VIAFAKLDGRMSGAPLIFPNQHLLNAGLGALLLLLVILFVISGSPVLFWLIAILAFALGFLLILPIGGADMPVVVSMLNSYSGWAAAGIGFTIGNLLLIVTGALVGRLGRHPVLHHVQGDEPLDHQRALGGFGSDTAWAAAAGAADRGPVKAGSPEDAAFIMKNAGKIIVVPGYGMAVAQAQQVLREMADL